MEPQMSVIGKCLLWKSLLPYLPTFVAHVSPVPPEVCADKRLRPRVVRRVQSGESFATS